MSAKFDFAEFDKQWLQLGREISQAIYTNPEVQNLKHALQKHGFLTLEEKSEFIVLCNTIKYEVIFGRFGPEDSKTYGEFSENWKKWFQAKGVESEKNRSQRSSVDHILFGSTPDPAKFLLQFEEEILGSM